MTLLFLVSCFSFQYETLMCTSLCRYTLLLKHGGYASEYGDLLRRMETYSDVQDRHAWQHGDMLQSSDLVRRVVKQSSQIERPPADELMQEEDILAKLCNTKPSTAGSTALC
ncbi:hypothetical protein QQ045_023221 [Rhodiola kirilowii]